MCVSGRCCDLRIFVIGRMPLDGEQRKLRCEGMGGERKGQQECVFGIEEKWYRRLDLLQTGTICDGNDVTDNDFCHIIVIDDEMMMMRSTAHF